jgi:YidC/Oxa1 family membrane protein insertase
MELINVATGMPWFWTIVAGTAFWRALCVPFAVFALRASARMQPHQAAIEKHRLDVMEAYKSKNQLQLLRAQAASTAFNKKHGINPFAGLAGLVQLPITLGTFFAVREMGLLPVEQLKQSGFALIPDLTVPDPTYMLPALLCALVNLQISVAAKDMTLDARPGMGHLMNFLRIFSVMGFYVMTDFSGVSILALIPVHPAHTLYRLSWSLCSRHPPSLSCKRLFCNALPYVAPLIFPLFPATNRANSPLPLKPWPTRAKG